MNSSTAVAQKLKTFQNAISKFRNHMSTKFSNSTYYLFERINFKFIHGYRLDLKNPKSFSEKIIWKKLFDRNPLLPIVADKYAVRDYVRSKLGSDGEAILIPQLWVGDAPEDIPFETLPERYIIKANHGSRMNLIHRPENPIAKETAINTLKTWLDTDFGIRRNEWCYSQIPRKIVIEELLTGDDNLTPQDIKLYMFRDQLGMILINRDGDGKRRSAFFDKDLNRIKVRKSRRVDPTIALPENIDEAIKIAKLLGQDFDHIRVDLYSHKGKIYFGELTNYSASGRVAFKPRSYDFELGKLWELDLTHARRIGAINFKPPQLRLDERPKIAITVQKYHHPGQTFVNRHINHLFGGNTCVIAERHYNTPPREKPNAFYMSDVIFNPADMIAAPYMAYKNYREHHGFRVPFGHNKNRLIDFIEVEGAHAILSEFGSQSMLVATLGKELGIPVFCYFRGRDASYWLQNKTRVKAYEKLFPQLAGIFAVSQFLLDNLAAKGLSHPNSHVVPSGTDIDLFAPDKKDPNLALVVGRFVKKKNPLLNIKAFKDIANAFPNARLEMVGDGPELASCENFVKLNNLEDRVIFHGKKDSAFIASRLNSASIFMQHSVIDDTGEAEGLPSSIQEAMAAGCAINSTDHAGIPELVTPGQNGYLCAENDLQAYTENYRKLLSDIELTAQMGRVSRKIAEEKIDYRKLYAHVENVMLNLIQSGR